MTGAISKLLLVLVLAMAPIPAVRAVDGAIFDDGVGHQGLFFDRFDYVPGTPPLAASRPRQWSSQNTPSRGGHTATTPGSSESRPAPPAHQTKEPPASERISPASPPAALQPKGPLSSVARAVSPVARWRIRAVG